MYGVTNHITERKVDKFNRFRHLAQQFVVLGADLRGKTVKILEAPNRSFLKIECEGKIYKARFQCNDFY